MVAILAVWFSPDLCWQWVRSHLARRSSLSAFTRLGSALWNWEPWVTRTEITRLFWLALYTSGEAKRHVPGLWQGGFPSMADAARISPDKVIDALDELLDHEMVEYDPKTRVLRLCMLPDPGE